MFRAKSAAASKCSKGIQARSRPSSAHQLPFSQRHGCASQQHSLWHTSERPIPWQHAEPPTSGFVGQDHHRVGRGRRLGLPPDFHRAHRARPLPCALPLRDRTVQRLVRRHGSSLGLDRAGGNVHNACGGAQRSVRCECTFRHLSLRCCPADGQCLHVGLLCLITFVPCLLLQCTAHALRRCAAIRRWRMPPPGRCSPPTARTRRFGSGPR